MKNDVNLIVVLILFVSCMFSTVNAQQLTNENTYLIAQYFQQQNNATTLLENKVTNNSDIPAQGSVVILNQLGNKNLIDIKSSANNSQQVSQLGNKNNYTFINYYNANPSNFNVLQQGTSNFLQIYGQNSIVDKISIIQKSNFKTIQIINY